MVRYQCCCQGETRRMEEKDKLWGSHRSSLGGQMSHDFLGGGLVLTPYASVSSSVKWGSNSRPTGVAIRVN